MGLHDSETNDKLIQLCDAATTKFDEFIQVQTIPDWLAVRLRGHVCAMYFDRFNLIPAVAAVEDIELFRTNMMESEKTLFRSLELRINDCVTWRLQLSVPFGCRATYTAAIEVAFSCSRITYHDFLPNMMQAYHQNVGKEFKKRAFRSTTKDSKIVKIMVGCSEHWKRVSQQREGLWKKFMGKLQKWYIYDDHHMKANIIGGSVHRDLIMGTHVQGTDWIKLSDHRGYVHMWGWKFVDPTDGTGVVDTSVSLVTLAR